MILFYVPFPNKKDAKKAAVALLRKKLIACANIFPSQSMFTWEGKTKDTKEYLAIFKTSEKNQNKVKSEIKKHHPYKLPAIIRIKSRANKEFEKWVEEQTKP